MPITKSAKKALRQNVRRREKNLKRKSDLKSVIKTYKKLLAEGKKEEARHQLSLVYKKTDKLAKTNYINKNKASRIKSRLAQKLNAVLQ